MWRGIAPKHHSDPWQNARRCDNCRCSSSPRLWTCLANSASPQPLRPPPQDHSGLLARSGATRRQDRAERQPPAGSSNSLHSQTRPPACSPRDPAAQLVVASDARLQKQLKDPEAAVLLKLRAE
ncbi:hypothetical protein NDU88_005530 [Pleurodeles waltl]|uniref:Uncharacterized protein n=1 Tax=Pleurodeles waltl TaxID=8319 RepID=A0AAV7WBP9_PLEWA|nr:hypothetical protein NDU88_005530 [Pleurodeles waltl]